jgi:hypothetical protein
MVDGTAWWNESGKEAGERRMQEGAREASNIEHPTSNIAKPGKAAGRHYQEKVEIAQSHAGAKVESWGSSFFFRLAAKTVARDHEVFQCWRS